MDSLGAFVLAAVALEAVIHILGNLWGERTDWGVTTIAYYAIPIIALFVAGDSAPNIAGAYDFDVDALGTIITGLAAGRVAMWVSALYKRTAG